MIQAKRKLEWFFDVISPFAYLQLERLNQGIDLEQISYQPIVLGALLNHWNTRGPAEIPRKRIQTYRTALERAELLGLPFCFPPVHPFNPLPLLRIIVGVGACHRVVQGALRYVWRDGLDPDNLIQLDRYFSDLGFTNAIESISQNDVKAKLRRNTDRAIEYDVFGVPTLVIDQEYFWGEDATSMALKTYSRGSDWLHGGQWGRIVDLPVGVERSRQR